MIKNKFKSTFVFALILMGTIIVVHSLQAKEETPLSQLAKALEKHDTDITEWTLYAKKNLQLNRKDFFQKMKHLETQYRQYKWSIKEEDHVVKATGILYNEKNQTTMKLQLVSTLKNDSSSSYLLYEQSGAFVRDNWSHTYEQFERKVLNIFQEKVTIFSCLKGELNGMMNIVLQKKAKDLADEFSAEPVEQLNEPNFVSISAYTTRWKNYISTADHKMNLQIAIRSSGMGGKHMIVIGTPIVTSEY
ncbi:YwmB family TATA-box binding protein [Bacillus gobiensis]|uniref:YwmB family TATA-box binding protein n=1 Tax=Bacillus gobiensis TaxID=1441095 RepID=UPI003D1ABD1E